ncbi:YdcF family protein [Dokdonella soli]|uniref:YdcF family protein n=2 Tax=Dokdonella soli TaxID=529810 RepID=A0ABN1ID78_9GAMM
MLLAAFGLFGLCLRRYRTAAVFCALGGLWITLCAMPAFAGLLKLGLENQYPRYEAATYPTADAIVVLGGGDSPSFGASSHVGTGTSSVQATRAGLGLELYRESKAPIVLLSGGDGEAVDMAHQLEQQGVLAQSLKVESTSVNTYQNALYSAAILRHEGRNRILLVTSSWTMSRAAACFRRQGLEVIPAPAFDRENTRRALSWQPQRASLAQSGRWLHEYIGLLVYKLRGWA